MATDRHDRKLGRWLWTFGGLVGTLLVVFALVVGPWLFTRYPQHGLTAEQKLKAQNDVRATLVQALGGLAVAGGAIVTYRTFRQNQRDQQDRRTEEDRTYQQRETEQDRTYALRRAEQVNEFYARAVEQLGHVHAPVRLGALHSLAQLAQANPDQRQTVVDVLCAYLRMPYTPPVAEDPADEQVGPAGEAARPRPSDFAMQEESARETAQELQVRQTAQRLLATHLRRPPDIAEQPATSPDETFWPGMSLDLAGAVLVDLDLSEASIVRAGFGRASFSGDTVFAGATFTGDVSFQEATFTGHLTFQKASFSETALFTAATFGFAGFGEATFTSNAAFDRATFMSGAMFEGVAFTGEAVFRGAKFDDYTSFTGGTFASADFTGATFSRGGTFNATTFNSYASFDDAHFERSALFSQATFNSDTRFNHTTFTSDAVFGGARFNGYSWFSEATFNGDAVFEAAVFTGNVLFRGVTFALDPGLEGLQPDPEDPTSGWLVPTENR